MIKVLLIDDHEMVRLGVSAYLSIQEDIEVIGEAENGQIGYEKALELRPDVIMMDLVMDVMDGIESTKAILKDWPEARIIIVTSFIDDEKVYPNFRGRSIKLYVENINGRRNCQCDSFYICGRIDFGT